MTLQLVIAALNTATVETLAKFLNFFRVLVSQVSSSRDCGGFQILLILLTSLSNAFHFRNDKHTFKYFRRSLIRSHMFYFKHKLKLSEQCPILHFLHLVRKNS